MSALDPKLGLFQTGPSPAPYEPVTLAGTVVAFAQIGAIVRAYLPAPPEQGYVGRTHGWYPERPRRHRKVTRP